MKPSERQRQQDKQELVDLRERFQLVAAGRQEALDELRSTLESDHPPARESGDFEMAPVSVAASPA